ncbi:hypothetical protein GCM10010094_24260 [Streptomyces flaveus]|uniref:Uncharacterized protein n=1 Tax=Streptomyces flaveus TaxID=66370 RepID=A0A917VCH4_9ACTN|nr:hypothetical protein GCM10010094_24260 [Streptomyces flaveus]
MTVEFRSQVVRRTVTGLAVALGGSQVEGPPTAKPAVHQQFRGSTKGADAIRIARPRKHSAGYRKTPDWKVVPGHVSTVPALPPLFRAG